MPDLNFSIEAAEVLPYAAAPSLLFKLRMTDQERTTPGQPCALIRSIMLKVQIQIVTAQRHYLQHEAEQLVELFGAPQRWGDTLKTLLWTNVVVLVPAFNETTVVDLPIPCTYDFEVVSAKYFHALETGKIPLEFLFSGTLFYDEGNGLQAMQIPWDKEANFQLPVQLWQQMMQHYFPDSAWVRLRQDLFDRLYRYKSAKGLVNWDAAIEALLAKEVDAA